MSHVGRPPLAVSPAEARQQKRMTRPDKTSGFFSRVWQLDRAFIPLLVIVAGYGLYMLIRYVKVETDLNRRSAIIVHPRKDEGSVLEIGYIYSMRDEIFLRDDNRINLVWFVRVPATGKRYSCSFDRGFSEFRTGDDVVIVRPSDLSEGGYGYVTGLHEKVTGKSVLVWVIDEDDLDGVEVDPAPAYEP
jgi:hypothetical protein